MSHVLALDDENRLMITEARDRDRGGDRDRDRYARCDAAACTADSSAGASYDPA
jgi:hypothetical protein